MLLENTLKKLVSKEFYYKDLFQSIIDLFYQMCLNNPSCQKILLPNLNYFLDMMNQRIVTDHLISEIIKSNADEEHRKNFGEYLVSKIINEGYFQSSLIQQLIKLASDKNDSESGVSESDGENSNQQFILKKIIESQKFRELLIMKTGTISKKIGIIKAYIKKRDFCNQRNQEDDEDMQQEKESLGLHLAIIDLVAACAKNSPFGIAQV